MAVLDTEKKPKGIRTSLNAMKNFPKRSQSSQKKAALAEAEAKKNDLSLPLPGPLPPLPTFAELSEDNLSTEPHQHNHHNHHNHNHNKLQKPEPKVLEPKYVVASKPSTAESRNEQKVSEPRYVEPRSPKSRDSKTISNGSEPRYVEPRSPKSPESRKPELSKVAPAEPRYVEPKSPKSKVSEPKYVEPRTLDPRRNDINGNAPKPIDRRAPRSSQPVQRFPDVPPVAPQQVLPNGEIKTPKPIHPPSRRRPFVPEETPVNGLGLSNGHVNGHINGNGNGYHDRDLTNSESGTPPEQKTNGTIYNNNPVPRPWTPPEIVDVTPPLTKAHYACYQGHASMPASRNAWHSIPCMTCTKADREIRFRCVYCCLRICSGCFEELQKTQDRSLAQLLGQEVRVLK